MENEKNKVEQVRMNSCDCDKAGIMSDTGEIPRRAAYLILLISVLVIE